MNILEFHIDNSLEPSSDDTEPGLELSHIKKLIELPVLSLHLKALGDDLRQYPADLVGLLLSQSKPPELYAEGRTFDWCAIHHFKMLVKIPLRIMEVDGDVAQKNLQEFCELAKLARKSDGQPTEFVLDSGRYTAGELTAFQGLRVTKLYKHALDPNTTAAELKEAHKDMKPKSIWRDDEESDYSLEGLLQMLAIEDNYDGSFISFS